MAPRAGEATLANSNVALHTGVSAVRVRALPALVVGVGVTHAAGVPFWWLSKPCTAVSCFLLPGTPCCGVLHFFKNGNAHTAAEICSWKYAAAVLLLYVVQTRPSYCCKCRIQRRRGKATAAVCREVYGHLENRPSTPSLHARWH